MAECDSCWPMEEDAGDTDVEPWHWTEHNAFLWSKDKLSELLLGLEIEAALGAVKITEIMKCEGNVVVYNRKNDFKHFYELRLDMKWEGATNCGISVEGRVIVPYLSEEYSIKDTDIETYFVEDGAESSYFGSIMKNSGEIAIKDKISQYVTALENDFPTNVMNQKDYEMAVCNLTEIVE